MNGKFLLDTNAVVALLNGNASLTQTLQTAVWFGISVITELEFFVFSRPLIPRRDFVPTI